VSESHLPEVLPAPLPTVLPTPPERYPEAKAAPKERKEVLHVAAAEAAGVHLPRALPTAGRPLPGVVDFLLAVGGWLWRWLVGAAMCFNYFLLSWLTAIAAVGWTNRVVQMMVLRCWWWRSDIRKRGTFAQFCDALGPAGPVLRPRWFWMEHLLYDAARPVRGGRQPGPLTILRRIVFWPWYGLWQNFKIGLKATFCTYAMLGLPCIFMLWSWEQGWLNSFHGGYEQAWFGPTMGFLGIVLFIAAAFYVPMAQAHQAATGQARAFFDFRFVWLLIQNRLTAYLWLAAAIGFWSMMLHAARIYVVAPNFAGNAAATPAEGLAYFQRYLFVVSLIMFPVYVILRIFAGVVYQSAVAKVLRRGLVTQAELHPVLRGWLERLELKIVPVAEAVSLTWYARLSARWTYRRILFTFLFFMWMAFIVRFYVGYFFVYDPYSGFLNHPLIQIPSFDFIPFHLYQGREF
jgi:hypothetical protein